MNESPASENRRSAPVALGTEPETRKLLSSLRIKVAFMVFVSVLLLGLCGMIFYLVSRIFGALTPAVSADLGWKAERGAAELAQAAQYGMVLGDEQEIRKAFRSYEIDPDVLAIVATDKAGNVLVQKGKPPGELGQVFQIPERQGRRSAGYFVAWSESSIEGSAVGRIAVFVSTARIEAGARLQREILWTAGIGCGLGLLASFLFVGFYVGPLIRVTETAFARLEETTREALEAVRLKSEFLANMSHEIRTPMNGILGMLELLGRTTLSAKQRRYTGTLSTSANGLMTVLNDILDFSKIEAGKLELHSQSCEPRALLEEVAELFAAQAERKHLELLYHVHSDVPGRIEVDADRLRQVITNLVGNAIKFTDAGEVVVRASATRTAGDDCLLELGVVDTGIGIDLASQKGLFQAFSQVDGSSTRRFGGTGLGLAISMKLVKLMGGELSVQSELGKGSSFFVRIPVRVLAAEPAHLQSPKVRRNTRTLIVDDNATNRLLLEELLSSWGLRTESASSGAVALGLLAEAELRDPFGLVITDMHMPEMDGLELARTIRERHQELPLLMLTSLSDAGPELADRSLFSGILSKPVRSGELESNIARALGDNARSASIAPRFAEEPATGEPRRLLVAEDNPVNQEVMTELLESLGYHADVVGNGRLAVEAWASEAYPVILMDCQMPELDGYEAARQIRSREQAGARVALIAVTAHAMVGERERALAAGMDDYITKPLNPKQLEQILSRWWPRRSHRAPPPSSSSIPASADDSSAGVLDPTVHRSQGVVRIFLKFVPDQLESIARALDAADQDGLCSAAHKLKGSCLSVGVPRMAALCASLEARPANAADLKQQLDQEFVRVQSHLTGLLTLKTA